VGKGSVKEKGEGREGKGKEEMGGKERKKGDGRKGIFSQSPCITAFLA